MGAERRGAGVDGGIVPDGRAAARSHDDDSATELVVPAEMRAGAQDEQPPLGGAERAAGDDEENTDLMAVPATEAERAADGSVAADVDPVVEIGPIGGSGPEPFDPVEQTQESIAVDIDRPALPFEPPPKQQLAVEAPPPGATPRDPPSLWSRKPEHSTVDPAELPSSLAPSAMSQRAAITEASTSPTAWVMVALVAVAAALALILALAL